MNVFIRKPELPGPGEFKYFDFPELKNEVLIWNRPGQGFMVYSSFCPHFGGPLAVRDSKLHCYFHDYLFDAETGACINRNFGGRCTRLAYFEEDNGLVVEVAGS
jgi:nitrite reductase/ring-hydroxylating ferredoxin subunit